MRTTLDTNDTLLTKANELALQEQKPLRTIVEEALREKLTRYPAPGERKPLKLEVSENTGGLRPGIDLDNSADIYDRMETFDASL